MVRRNSTLFYMLLLLYILTILYITLFAWNYGASLGPTGPGGRNFNLIPFRSIYRITVFSSTWLNPFKILIGNILMFIPFGFFILFFQKNKRKLRLVVAYGFLLSFLIEGTQFLFTYRVADIDDLILNTFGAWCGGVTFLIYYEVKRRIIVLT